MPEVWLPPRMQAHCGGNQQVVVPGATVRQVINNLEREYPGSRDLLMDVEEDDLLPGLAVVVDGETSLLGLLERVQENSEVHFLPAIGGGKHSLDIQDSERKVLYQFEIERPGNRPGLSLSESVAFSRGQWMPLLSQEPLGCLQS